VHRPQDRAPTEAAFTGIVIPARLNVRQRSHPDPVTARSKASADDAGFKPASALARTSARRNIDAPERATHDPNHRDSRSRGSAMDVPDRAEQESEAICVARSRELLGDHANTLTDDEVLAVARHAEALAHIMIDLALQDGRIH
jgi:hypothetical protein